MVNTISLQVNAPLFLPVKQAMGQLLLALPHLLQPIISKPLQDVYLVCLKLPFRKKVKAEVAPERHPVIEQQPCINSTHH